MSIFHGKTHNASIPQQHQCTVFAVLKVMLKLYYYIGHLKFRASKHREIINSFLVLSSGKSCMSSNCVHFERLLSRYRRSDFLITDKCIFFFGNKLIYKNVFVVNEKTEKEVFGQFFAESMMNGMFISTCSNTNIQCHWWRKT